MFSTPNHISWNISGLDTYPELLAITPSFNFEYLGIPNTSAATSYKEAINNKLLALVASGHSKLAILISGKDGEIIAIQAKKLGIDFELFFLHIQNINEYMLPMVNTVSTALSVPINVITLPHADIIPFAEQSFLLTRVNKPTYLVLPYIFDKIPADRYIIIGEGDLDKSPNAYSHISNPANDYGIPILNTEIAYYIHAQSKNIVGDYYFHSSTPELIKTMWDHPLLDKKFPVISTLPVLQSEWGAEITFTEKTSNWDTIEGRVYNTNIRMHISTKYACPVNALTTVVLSSSL